ncbi:hypothetical protein C8Q75DRAFT_742951 [Abortiporus biennis]|nr:hypothetical protein C8Q75DRAFT_742951 [Abortiporus biennis]
MAPSRTAKGKKKALITDDRLSEPSSSRSTPQPTVKKPKRAVTRKCPVCDEEIPVRLLATHAAIEDERLEEIIRNIGSTEVLDEAEPDDGLTARVRRSALKARKIMQPHFSSTKLGQSSETTLEVIDKELKTLKRHRKQRNVKLREMTKEEEEITGLSGYRGGRGRWAGRTDGEGTTCPVCRKLVQGDPDVVEAHVDACLAHEASLQDERDRQAKERRELESIEHDGWEEVEVDGEIRIRVTDGVTFQGTGFDVRDRSQQDVEDDIDVDGDDDVIFGAAQFTEQDILAAEAPSRASHSTHEDEDVQIDDDSEAQEEEGVELPTSITLEKSLKDLVAEGKLVKRRLNPEEPKQTLDEVMGVGEAEQVDRDIDNARVCGDNANLITALENKVKLLESTRVSSSTSSLCRICIDPYNEPTVSTGCWHTCCRECWLRCLGSTKLCPICKRITSASDLRRIYL